MTVFSSYGHQAVFLWLGLLPPVLVIVVVVAARLEQRRANSEGAAGKN